MKIKALGSKTYLDELVALILQTLMEYSVVEEDYQWLSYDEMKLTNPQLTPQEYELYKKNKIVLPSSVESGEEMLKLFNRFRVVEIPLKNVSAYAQQSINLGQATLKINNELMALDSKDYKALKKRGGLEEQDVKKSYKRSKKLKSMFTYDVDNKCFSPNEELIASYLFSYYGMGWA